jgi:hypothetical protein
VPEFTELQPDNQDATAMVTKMARKEKTFRILRLFHRPGVLQVRSPGAQVALMQGNQGLLTAQVRLESPAHSSKASLRLKLCGTQEIRAAHAAFTALLS